MKGDTSKGLFVYTQKGLYQYIRETLTWNRLLDLQVKIDL